MMLQTSPARHLTADTLRQKQQARTERSTEKTHWPRKAELYHQITKTREKTQKQHSKTDTACSCFFFLEQVFSFFFFFLPAWPRPLPSALAPSSSVLQLLAGSRARRPAKSLSGLWTGPDGLCGPQRVQLCRPQNNISGSHTRGELMALPPFVCWCFPVVLKLTQCA